MHKKKLLTDARGATHGAHLDTTHYNILYSVYEILNLKCVNHVPEQFVNHVGLYRLSPPCMALTFIFIF
jgi:hypothetical protein